MNPPDNPWIGSPGADDDASGVASLPEISRVIIKRNFAPKSSIKLIAFGAEELNMDGSNDCAAIVIPGSKKIKWMLNSVPRHRKRGSVGGIFSRNLMFD